jgi:hypothetical protein
MGAEQSPRSRAGRWRGVLAAAVLGGAVVVTVPAIRSEPAPEPGPPPQEEAAEVYTAPTRGPLADDADVLEAIRRLQWTGAATVLPRPPDPPVGTRHVVWAADTERGRFALVTGTDTGTGARDPGSVVVAWFAGPPGAGPDELTVRGVPHAVDPAMPSALVDAATGTAVVVGAPDDRVEVSVRPEIAADGTVTRDYEQVPARDGVTVGVVRGDSRLGTALRYRVVRGGERLAGETALHVPPGTPAPDLRVTDLRPAPRAAAADAGVAARMEDLLGRTGLPADQVAFTVVWSGESPQSGGPASRLTLVTAELPSGAVHVSAVLAVGGSALSGVPCGSEIRPAGAPVDRQLFVVACAATLGTPPGGEVRGLAAALVVVAPPGTATARARDDAYRVLGEYPLTGGVAVVPAPAGLAAVEVLAADGAILDRRPLLRHADLGD